jgi:holin-like protein
MAFLNGITILLVYQLLGEVLVRYFGWPVPGPVVGMLLLFLTLAVRGQVGEGLSRGAGAVLDHLPLLFVPAGVGVITHFDRIVDDWIPMLLALTLGTAFTLAATAFLMLAAQRLLGRGGGR